MTTTVIFDSNTPCRTVATTSPGSVLARQIRVQYRAPSQSLWMRYATCRRAEQAQQCQAELERRGFHTRLVSYQICPVAS